jgi:hypothetical protein
MNQTGLRIKIAFADPVRLLESSELRRLGQCVENCVSLPAATVELQELREPQTKGFPIAAAVNVDLSGASFPSALRGELLFQQLTEVCRSETLPVGDRRLAVLALTQDYYGMRGEGDAIVTSYYDWNYSRTEERRQQAMHIHLEMEKRELLFQAVHFGSVIQASGSSLPAANFVFEGYCRRRQDVETIYAKPALEEMRQHSSEFLDVGTRKLAFGRVARLLQLRAPALTR